MIDLAQTSNELAAALNILRDLIKDSWKASEEMERIRRSSYRLQARSDPYQAVSSYSQQFFGQRCRA